MAKAIDKQTVLDLIIEAKRADPETGSFAERLAEYLVEHLPTLTPPNEPLTWEELKSKTKINPVYSVKYGWIFPSTVKDEPYKQIWFFTSKGFAQTELFYRDTFYRRPPEGEA